MAKLYQLTARKDGIAIAGMIGVKEEGVDEMRSLMGLEFPETEVEVSPYDPDDLLSIPDALKRD